MNNSEAKKLIRNSLNFFSTGRPFIAIVPILAKISQINVHFIPQLEMIRSPEFAAEQIYAGLTKKNGFEIHFPKVFTYMMKFLRILPSSIYFRFLEKGMKKINY